MLGGLAGIAYATGYTIVGLEVEDGLRGRTFAFIQSAIQIILLASVAAAPVLSGVISEQRRSGGLRIGRVDYRSIGDNALLLLAAVVAVLLGVISYRRMDDRRGIPLIPDLLAAIRGEELVLEEPKRPRGLLLALEGGEGAGKTTQARLLGIWLRDQGYEVVATHEPGATKVGMRLRALLLDKSHAGLSSRAETLMYAADRAEHVAAVIQPALDRGAIVITDRYVDSSLAYQGAGRELPVEEVARLNRWATGGMMPDLTILLDLPPAAGLSRRAPSADRLESEPIGFHERVSRGSVHSPPPSPAATWSSTRRCRPSRSAAGSRSGSGTSCPTPCRPWPRRSPAASPPCRD